MKILHWSIRTYLTILVLIITLPAMAIIYLDGLELEQQAVKDAHETALRFTKILAYKQEQMTNNTRQLLSMLAQVQEVKQLDSQGCNRILREIHKVIPAYENLFIVARDGRIIASVSPIPSKPIGNLTECKYYRDAIATKDFSAGEYVTSMFSGRQAFHFSYPVFDSPNRVCAVVVAELNLEEYGSFFKASNLPEESMLSISDHRGIRLFTDPFNSTHPSPGISERQITMEHMSTGKNDEGTYTGTGTDGVHRLYGFLRLHLKHGTEPYMYIRTGLSEDVALAQPRLFFLRNMLLIGTFLILALTSAWFLGDYLIVYRLKKLVSATHALAEGGTGVRTGLDHNEGELGELAAAFDRMADKLKKRGDEQHRAEQERQRLELQLQHAQKMEAIGTFAGGIAHDFNNILASIIGNTELTAEEPGLTETQHECLDEVLVACFRAKDLVHQILSFSRQGEEQETNPFDVVIIIKEIVKLLHSILPATIQIKQRITSHEATVVTNPTQVHQVILNLATNAAHAMKEHGGTLLVGVDLVDFAEEEILSLPKGSYVHITVEDTGTGIDPAIMDRIFDPFFTTKKSGEGTGLGLSVVYGIVKNIGGGIDVKSILGKGTTIHIYLPHCPQIVEKQNDLEEKIIGGHEHILLVDDESALTEMGRKILNSLGYRVTAVSNSIKALEIFRKQPESFDLLLADITMPNMTGMALAREVLIIRPDFPVVLYTGYADYMTAEEAKRIGVRAFAMKPLSRSDIAGILRRVLDNREAPYRVKQS